MLSAEGKIPLGGAGSWEEAAQTCWREGRWLWDPRDGMDGDGAGRKRGWVVLSGCVWCPCAFTFPKRPGAGKVLSASSWHPWDAPGGMCSPGRMRMMMRMGSAPPLDEILCDSRAIDQAHPRAGNGPQCCQERVWVPGALRSFVEGPEHTGGSGRQENPWSPPATPDDSILACWDFQ